MMLAYISTPSPVAWSDILSYILHASLLCWTYQRWQSATTWQMMKMTSVCNYNFDYLSLFVCLLLKHRVVDWYISSLTCFSALAYINNLDLVVENDVVVQWQM
jgi:hypothetical protein